MTIKKRGSTWWYAFCVNGVRYRGSCFTEKEKEAQEFHDKIKNEVWRGKQLKDSVRHTWTEALDRWLHEHQHNRTAKANVKFGDWWTAQFKEHKVKYLNDINSDLFKVIRDNELNRPRQRNGKQLAPATVNRKIALLRAVVNAAAREYQWMDTAPLFRCLPERNERVRYLTPTEIQRLLGELQEPYKSMALLAVATGLRQSNIFQLTWRQVDFVRKQITFPEEVMKNGMALTIPINETAMQAIKPWIGKDDQFVFVLPNGNPVKELLSKMWKNALARSGISNFKWHDLRHTWASLMRQSGEGLDKIQEMGGWQDPKMVRRYAHLSTEHLAKSASAIDRVLEMPDQGMLVSYSGRVEKSGTNLPQSALS
jgi:integrase